MLEPNKATTKQEQAIAWRNAAQFDQSEKAFKEIVAALAGPSRSGALYAEALNDLALLYQMTAEYERALNCFEEGRKAKELALGIDHPEVAIALRHLSEIEATLGHIPQADRYASRALSIWLEFLGYSDEQTARKREAEQEDMNDLNLLYGPRSNDGLAPKLFVAMQAARNSLAQISAPQAMFEIGSLFSVRRLFKDAKPFFQLCLEKSGAAEFALMDGSLKQLGTIAEYERNFHEAEELLHKRLLLLTATLSSEHPQIAQVKLSLARLALLAGRRKDAKALALEARESLDASVGEESPDYAEALSVLAHLAEAEADLVGAEMFLKKSIEIIKAKFSEEHPLTIRQLDSLTRIHVKQKRFDEAEAIYYRAIDVMGNSIGEQPLVLSEFYSALSNVYIAQGKFAKAESVLQKALTIRQNHLVHNDVQIATTLSELGNLYLSFGKYQESEGNLKRALGILASRKPLAGEDLEKNEMLRRLAKCHLKQGRFLDAEKLLKDELDDLERFNSPDSFAFVPCLEALAIASLFQYKWKNAEKALKRAREIVEGAAKTFSPDAASLFLTIGDAQLLANNFESAHKQYEMALAGASAEIDGAPVVHVKAIRRLAVTCELAGEKEKARQLLTEAFQEADDRLSTKAEEQIRTILQSADFLLKNNEIAEALTLYKQAMHVCDHQIGPHNPLTAQINIHFARWHAARQEFRQATEFYMRATSILDGSLGSSHWQLIAPLAEFAMVSKTLGALKDAETLLRRAHTIAEKSLGATDTTTSSVLSLLLAVLREEFSSEPKLANEIQMLESRLKATLAQSSAQEQNRLDLVSTVLKGEFETASPFRFVEPRQILADALSR